MAVSLATSAKDEDDLVADSDALFKRLKNWFALDYEKQSDWRKDAREDFGFEAGEQLNDEDKAILRDTNRPIVIMNRIGPVIDSVTGSEVSNRQEVQFIPRTQGDVQVNEVLTSAAKWFRDQCDAEDEESDAFRDTVVCGMGWTETRLDYEDEPEGNVRLWTSEKHRADAEVAAGRKMTPVYTTPPADTGMREALAFTREFIRGEQIESAVVGISSMQSLGEYIDTALAASEATKSDRGEERPASNPLSEVTHRPSAPHEPATVLTKGGEGRVYIGRPGDAHNLYEDSARDTRPADVTVEVRALIAFVQSVFDFYNEGHAMPMWIGRDARALLDAYKIGAK